MTQLAERRRLVAPSDRLCAITDTGRVRAANEDTFHVSEDGHFMVVADGMGGHQAGAVASALAVSALVEFVSARTSTIVPTSLDIGAAMYEGFQLAHRRVLEASWTRADWRGMGTTLIAALIHGKRLHTCHVGDVRCYVMTASGFHAITHDHSVVGTLVMEGRLAPEQARVHPQRNEILQAVGTDNEIGPELNTVDLAQGDQVVLCSDGLWEALADDEIAAVLDWDGPARQRAIQLVDRANRAGGRDNITVILYQHILADDEASAAALGNL